MTKNQKPRISGLFNKFAIAIGIRKEPSKTQPKQLNERRIIKEQWDKLFENAIPIEQVIRGMADTLWDGLKDMPNSPQKADLVLMLIRTEKSLQQKKKQEKKYHIK